MQKRIIAAGILILVLVGAAIYYSASRLGKTGDSKEVVSAGNIVQVKYTGRLENGTVFDTSDADVAREAGIYNALRGYDPLEFTVGQGQMIKGFDEGVLGMKVGEKKKLTLIAADAYGEYDPKKIQAIPRVDVINRTFEINRTVSLPEAQFKQFFNDDPKVDKIYETKQTPWKYKAKELKDGVVILEAVVKKGETYTLPGTFWESEVLEAGSIMKLQQNPKTGQVIPTPFGNATLTVSPKMITINVSPVKGAVIQGPFGQSAVKDFNETSILLDLNHPLAGKTLIFDVEIVNISQGTELPPGDFSALPVSGDDAGQELGSI